MVIFQKTSVVNLTYPSLVAVPKIEKTLARARARARPFEPSRTDVGRFFPPPKPLRFSLSRGFSQLLLRVTERLSNSIATTAADPLRSVLAASSSSSSSPRAFDPLFAVPLLKPEQRKWPFQRRRPTFWVNASPAKTFALRTVLLPLFFPSFSIGRSIFFFVRASIGGEIFECCVVKLEQWWLVKLLPTL